MKAESIHSHSQAFLVRNPSQQGVSFVARNMGTMINDSSTIDSYLKSPQNTGLVMKVHHHIPDTLLALPAHRLHEQLDGPRLYLLPGHTARPLFLSVLLHGNEYTGWEVVRRLLRRQYEPLQRPLALFIGNVQAARHRVRRLEGQPDFNRCWPGTIYDNAGCDNEIVNLFHRVTEWARAQNIVASIDIHNNTGNNPLYSIINNTSAAHRQLAADFTPMTVYTRYPHGTQSDAFSAIAPSITLECAQAGDTQGIEKALNLVQRYLLADAEDHLAGAEISMARQHNEQEQAVYGAAPLNKLQTKAGYVSETDACETALKPRQQLLSMYRMRARITVPAQVDIARLPENGELRLAPDLDQYNFRPLPSATVLGQTQLPLSRCLQAQDGDGQDVTDEFFELSEGALRTRREIIPGMFTSDPIAIQRDCLGYIMEAIGD